MPSAPLRVLVLGQLGPHRAAWDDLVARQPRPSPFLRSWWIDHVAEGELQVVACFDGDRLVGGAAFELGTVRIGPFSVDRVRMAGQGILAPDHLDLIAEPRDHLEVSRAVSAWLRRPGSRMIDLDGLAANGTLASLFAPFEVERSAAPFADLGDDVTEYLAGRPGKVRSTVKRTAKRFDRDGVEFVRVGPDGIDTALAALAQLHEGRWAEDSKFLRGWERFCAGARAGAATGEVVIHELRDADGAPIASELDVVLGPTVAFYQAGRLTDHEWRGSGSVLRARIVEARAAAGATEYDMLRGDEPYKSDWATGRRDVLRCRLGVGPGGRLAIAALRLRIAIYLRFNRGASPPDP